MARNAARTLRSFLQRSGETQVSFGKRIGVSGTSVYLYLAGRIVPGEAIKKAIAFETGGAVKVGDWPVTDRRSPAPHSKRM